MSKPCTIEPSSREVIESRLLTALTEGNQVAILATKEDLETLIAVLRGYSLSETKHKGKDYEPGTVISTAKFEEHRKNLAEGMEQLLKEAFPK